MSRTFDLESLRTLVVGVQLGSFTRAASHLGRSQSAVSMQIKKLENRAGTPLFLRKGRGLVPTEAGEKLLFYARKIVMLNDEAFVALGTDEAVSNVKLGLPQDFFDIVLPKTVQEFSSAEHNVHVDVQAGRNFSLEDDVYSGRLDAAIAFFPVGTSGRGELLATLETAWVGPENVADLLHAERIPLVLFEHPCLFRSIALTSLEQQGNVWRVALTTPSLAGIWAAVRAKQGVTLRTMYRLPDDLAPISPCSLPPTDPIEVRLLRSANPSPVADLLCRTLRSVTIAELAPYASPVVSA